MFLIYLYITYLCHELNCMTISSQQAKKNLLKKRKKSATKNQARKKNKTNSEDEEERADFVESITSFKGSSKSGGYKVMVKWGGYEEGNDTSWEPVDELLQQWDCEASEIYAFFRGKISTCPNVPVLISSRGDHLQKKKSAKRKIRKKQEKRNHWIMEKRKQRREQKIKSYVMTSATIGMFQILANIKTKNTFAICRTQQNREV